jgi:outer membrane protein OmpA-like peptidoglycan-associated protein
VGILDHALEIRREGCGIGQVGIVGHADRSGRASRNVVLSRRRAAAVANYLEARGISPREVTMWALGDRRPLEATKDRLHESQNRRVEVILGPPVNK